MTVDPLARLAANVKARRKALKLTQEDAALRASMNMSYWGRIERATVEASQGPDAFTALKTLVDAGDIVGVRGGIKRTEKGELSVVGPLGKVEAFLPSSTVRVGLRATGRPGIAAEEVHDPRVAYEGFHHGSSYLEHLDFIDAIRTGGSAGVGLAEGRLSVAMGVAAQRSIAEGRAVTLAEVLGEAAS